MLKTAFTIAGIALSSPAFADIEIGAHTGYTMMSLDADDSAFTGTSFGFRAGKGIGMGLTPEANVTFYSGSKDEGDETLDLSQLHAGVGARFYIGDFFLRPFLSAHLNYAGAVSQSFSQGDTPGDTSDVPGTSGFGADIGAGIQLKILDLVYGELFGTYAKTFPDLPVSNLYVAAGVGVKF
jgi:hypothetical protein